MNDDMFYNTKIIYGTPNNYKTINGNIVNNMVDNSCRIIYKVETTTAMNRLLFISGLKYCDLIATYKIDNTKKGTVYITTNYVSVVAYSIKDVDKLIEIIDITYKTKSIYFKEEVKKIFGIT